MAEKLRISMIAGGGFRRLDSATEEAASESKVGARECARRSTHRLEREEVLRACDQ
jgi:hypothetical protein